MNNNNNSRKAALAVSQTSKKIRKRTQQTQQTRQKSYQTRTSAVRLIIEDKIRQIVDPKFEKEDWRQMVASFGIAYYSNILKKLFPQIESSKMHAEWKKIKRMMERHEKRDDRGNAIFGKNDEEKAEFAQHIENLIQTKEINTKCFNCLRGHALLKISEIYRRNGKKFSENMFQKHFWHDRRKEEESKALCLAWKKLPNKRRGHVCFVPPNHEIPNDEPKSESNKSSELEVEPEPELVQGRNEKEEVSLNDFGKKLINFSSFDDEDIWTILKGKKSCVGISDWNTIEESTLY